MAGHVGESSGVCQLTCLGPCKVGLPWWPSTWSGSFVVSFPYRCGFGGSCQNFFLMESDASKHMVLVKSPSFLSLFACFSWRMSRGTEGKMTSSLRWLQEQLFLLLILSLIDSFFGMACTFPYGLSRPYTAMGSNAISHHAQEANLRLLQIVLIEWVALWILY